MLMVFVPQKRNTPQLIR